MPFIINNINNGTLSSISAMPQKDSTSDGNSSFEMARSIYKRSDVGLLNPVVDIQKKWVGGNRDSSSSTTNRRNIAVGKGSINITESPMSFSTHKIINTIDDAKRRARSGGAIAPAKKNAKTNNAPTPRFSPAVPSYNNYIGIKYPYLFH